MKKTVLTLMTLILALSLVLSGCGGKGSGTPALKAGEALELTEWSMNATAWSSPNGATVNLTATPNGYTEGQSAQFCVRLEGEDIATVPCQWDGTVYTASAELNAADGYCYFVQLTSADGEMTEVAVNTPTAPTDDTLIHMATSLESYCEASVTDSALESGSLVVNAGSLRIQLPRLTLDTGAVSCEKAELVLTYNGEDIASQELAQPTANENAVCEMDLSGVSFSIPVEMEDDHQLSIRLNATLSNGQTVTAPAGTWYYLDGELLLAAG